MAIRKEQVLVLVCAAIGALIVLRGQLEPRRLTYNPQQLEYAAQAVADAPLVTGAAAGLLPRELFREPSETQPLPPRELPFPAQQPLFLVALPLDPGPDLAHGEVLAIDGGVVEGVTLQSAGENAASNTAPAASGPGGSAAAGSADAAPAGGQGPGRQDKERRWSRVYDQVLLVGQRTWLFGIVTPAGMDRFALEATKDFSAVTFSFLPFSLDKEKLMPPAAIYGGSQPGSQVQEVRLAQTLRNEVGRKIREVPVDAAHFLQRMELIDWLLVKGREDGEIFGEALRQVELLEQGGAGLRAQYARARVLAAKGDLAGEYAVYTAANPAADDGLGQAFKYDGLGRLRARLGLFVDAESDLRQAVAAMPTDARPHASLAAFLRSRGRPQEALAAAKAAAAALGAVPIAEDKQRVVATIVACQLGVGDIVAARAALTALPPTATMPIAFLKASIDYAAGDLAAARDGFRQASAGPDGQQAQLGVAACQLRLLEWQDAATGFEQLADQAPLLRHRAYAGLALLSLRLGQNDAALSWTDRALEAEPQDAYVLYLRARALAAQGRLDAAGDALQQALRLRDDFAPALAEMAAVRARMADEGALGDRPQNALAAMRYADRAVALAKVSLVTLFERQALARFHAANLRGAAQALATAQQAAANEEQRRFAEACMTVVDYSQQRIDDALLQLDRMLQDWPKEHPLRQWAEATRKLIDDHAQKEQLEDRFERPGPDLGGIWALIRDGNLQAVIDAGQVLFRGQFSPSAGAGAEVSATRTGAVPHGGKFLAVSTTMQIGPQHPQQGSFAGLRIQSKLGGAGGANDFVVLLGFRDHKPFLRLQDGKDEPVNLKDLPVADGNPTRPHKLELRVEPRDQAQFRLLALWDGQLVHAAEVKNLRTQTQTELETTLLVTGNKGLPVDVRFDDYHLERRKE